MWLWLGISAMSELMVMVSSTRGAHRAAGCEEQPSRGALSAIAPAGDVVTRVEDTSSCHVGFNVMPDRAIREELVIPEFRVGQTWIEAEFDRTYSSSMLNSPSHLTFVSALVQLARARRRIAAVGNF